MTIEFATITGPLTTPDGGGGIRARIDFAPETTDGVISFPGDAVTQGPVTVYTDSAGNFEVSEDDGGAKIPTSGPADGVVWKVTVTPLDKGPNGKLKPWTRRYEITEDASLDDLVVTEALSVTPTLVTDLTSYRDAAAASATSAATHDTSAQGWAEAASSSAADADDSADLAAISEANAAGFATDAAVAAAARPLPFDIGHAMSSNTSTAPAIQRSLRAGKLPACPRNASASSGSDGVATGEYSITAYQAMYAGVGFDLLFTNYNGANGTITVRASVVTPDGNIHQCFTTDGKSSLVIENGALGWMTAGGAVAAGDWVTVRVFVEARDAAGSLVSGGKWPQILTTALTSRGETVVTSGATDLTLAASGSQPAAVVGASYRPSGIFVQPLDPSKRKVVVIIGDSISRGTGDDDATPSGPGFIARALNGQIPYLNTAVAGTQIGILFTGAGGMGARMLEMATTAYEASGANNLGSGTFDSIRSAKIAYWRGIAAYGCRVRTITLFPWDSLTSGQKAIRASFNDWIRDGAPLDKTTYAAAATGASGANIVRFGAPEHPAHGYDEIADAVEVSRNGGTYKAGYSSDGVHPTATGATAASAAVNLAAIA